MEMREWISDVKTKASSTLSCTLAVLCGMARYPSSVSTPLVLTLYEVTRDRSPPVINLFDLQLKPTLVA